MIVLNTCKNTGYTLNTRLNNNSGNNSPFIAVMYSDYCLGKNQFEPIMLFQGVMVNTGSFFIYNNHYFSLLRLIKKCFLIGKFFSFVLVILYLFCVIPSGTAPSNLSMQIEGSDTISPYGSVTLQFNESLSDSIISMNLFPDRITLTAFIDVSTNSTVFKFPNSLQGNTHYYLIPQKIISSINGGTITELDTVSFFSGFKESEPNNTMETADNWMPGINGKISMVDDIDWYMIKNSNVKGIYLSEYESQYVFTVLDSTGKVLAADQLAIDTLFISEQTVIPLYVCVSTYRRASGGYYQIEVLFK